MMANIHNVLIILLSIITHTSARHYSRITSVCQPDAEIIPSTRPCRQPTGSRCSPRNLLPPSPRPPSSGSKVRRGEQLHQYGSLAVPRAVGPLRTRERPAPLAQLINILLTSPFSPSLLAHSVSLSLSIPSAVTRDALTLFHFSLSLSLFSLPFYLSSSTSLSLVG